MMVYLAFPMTLAVYYFTLKCFQKTQLAILNPILMAILALSALVFYFDMPLSDYKSGTSLLTALLEPAVIALAYPLYQQFVHVREKIIYVLVACTAGVLVGLITTAFVAAQLTDSTSVIASLIPKSVTTPIAMAISENIGGIPAITAVLVIIAGIFGNICAPYLLHHLKIKTPQAQGLAIGAGSHVIGTSKAMEMSRVHGAFSTISLLLSAIITAILAPILFPLLLTLFSG